MKTTIRVLDLFCGAGGFTLGAVLAGRRCGVEVETFGVDKWGPAVATSRRAGHRAIRADVKDLGAWIPECTPDVDLVIGGPPCQPFSHAGPCRGRRDPRDGYPAALKALEVICPVWAVLENVRGLLSDRHRSYREDEILNPLREMFGWAGVLLLDSADFGVPQHRRRSFIVAGPHPLEAPEVSHGREGLEAWRTVGAALGLGAERVIGGGRNPQAAGIKRTYRDITDEPCTTITATQIGNAGPWVESAGQRRRLTNGEKAAIQTFPPGYPWVGTKTEVCRQIGNAVPPLLGAAVLGAVLAAGRRGEGGVDSRRPPRRLGLVSPGSTPGTLGEAVSEGECVGPAIGT